jgi:hypothetical protein
MKPKPKVLNSLLARIALPIRANESLGAPGPLHTWRSSAAALDPIHRHTADRGIIPG